MPRQQKLTTNRHRNIRAIGGIGDVDKLRELLKDRPRDLLLFDMFTQTGLKMDILLNLKVSDLTGLSAGDELALCDIGRKPVAPIIITNRIINTFDEYTRSANPNQEDYLFKSRKGNRPLEPTTVSHLIRKWYREANLAGLTGTKSLRKTWTKYFKAGVDTSAVSAAHPRLTSLFEPIRAATLGEIVRSKLVWAILSGRIAPGERLHIKRIAEEMEVSPIPVRDALARLEASGFISLGKNRSYTANTLSRDNLLEIAKLRKLLEPLLAVMGCKNCTVAAFSTLAEIHGKLLRLQQEKPPAYADILQEQNKIFHFTLYQQAGMPILLELVRSLWQKVSPYMYLAAREDITNTQPIDWVRKHEMMLDGVKSGDCERVREGIIEDIEDTTRVALEEFFDKPTPGGAAP